MNDATRLGSVGLLPVGSLGVGFYYYLTRKLGAMEQPVSFVERSGSPSGRAIRSGGTLCIAGDDGVHKLDAAAICRPDLLDCAKSGWLPEILLVCTQSDQILSVIQNFVALLERLNAELGLEAALEHLPLLVLSSNGIYHQRVRRFLVETLEESTLYGRLPDLWSDAMGRIVGKLLRGVTMQTATRDGEGAAAIFHPGPPGLTRLAGGDAAHRQRCGEVLQALGGRFEVSDLTPTRVEFDKALVNLFANFLGQLKAIDEHGVFRSLKVKEILTDPNGTDTRELGRHVFAIGRAVQAYRLDEDFEAVYRTAMDVAHGAWEHVPSSIKWIETQLRAGKLKAQITPTEKWLLEPLIRYSSTAGLDDSTHYFKERVREIEERLGKAAERAAATSATEAVPAHVC